MRRPADLTFPFEKKRQQEIYQNGGIERNSARSRRERIYDFRDSASSASYRLRIVVQMPAFLMPS
ncbi:MAG TPA: hypothetical protein PKN49_12955, partial [Candidatus Aminicenantes bacterium]|nr:hypothetical protein [Candidatus Aminicenantes bacterium]